MGASLIRDTTSSATGFTAPRLFSALLSGDHHSCVPGAMATPSRRVATHSGAPHGGQSCPHDPGLVEELRGEDPCLTVQQR